MAKYSELTTKTAKEKLLREKLNKDDRWIARGLLTVFQYQTEDEKRSHETKEHNGVGFTGHDGQILTDFATRLIQRGGKQAAYDLSQPFSLEAYLTKPQAATLRNKMPKYAKQLLRLTS